ncbi:mCG146308, partial [Mus musculus]
FMRIKITPYKWKADVVVSVDALQQQLGPDTRKLKKKKKQRSWKTIVAIIGTGRPTVEYIVYKQEEEEEEICGFGDFQIFTARRKDATKDNI